MNGKLDWKGVGQFVAVLVRIWTIVKTVVNDGKVGLEMLDWIVGQGETWHNTQKSGYDLALPRLH